ncbi:hypothetical protein PV11_09924 [Exophiala sideris]|uniref:Zn(2)-C6 fungal-type domain-containing protein n=1 Tax=Exophiala sideris TaxID=1016849 RepID=A0A0D1WSV8_9EURO|nr:hypothetical protein PV11_09924 [Exophiala sideris]
MTSVPQPRANKTCSECRRRKIRCDGNQPCGQCVYYEVPDCQYVVRKRRKLASRPRVQGHYSVEESISPVSDTVTRPHGQVVRDESHGKNIPAANIILSKLFPSHSPEYLMQLSSSELASLAQASNSILSDQSPLDREVPDSGDERDWNEAQEQENPESQACDDVNGLSLNAHRRSFMGISSTRAILRAMLKLKPSIQQELSKFFGRTSSAPTTLPASQNKTPHAPKTIIDEQTCIEAYFEHVQGIIPLLDEDEFRNHWVQGVRCDSAWLALLNMVLALGAVAAGGPGDKSDDFYYSRAKEHFNFEFLGIGSIESLQALCLLGGCYLHYRNSPNMAYAVMGAAFRIALALGLHREPVNADGSGLSTGGRKDPKLETRRRIWWCLFCLDTWGGMTLGRPTLSRWDPGAMDVSLPSDFKDPTILAFFLTCTQRFCVLATKMQQHFANINTWNCNGVQALDQEVLDWSESTPSPFPPACPERLITQQYMMQNRYLNLRLLLYRPALLSWAARTAPFNSLQPDEQYAIQQCRAIACQAIEYIASKMHPLLKVRIWTASWYLYQACLVLLLSLIIEPEHAESWTWRSMIEKTLDMFESMGPWSVAASRSKRVVAIIYGACRVPLNDAYNDMSNVFDATAWDQLTYDMSADGWQTDTFSLWGDDFNMYSA